MIDLSVIIVSYNTSQLTHECIESLLHALIKTPAVHVQIIVIDNASIDESPNILNALKKNNNISNVTIEIIENKENVGFGKANNQGLQIAKGEYILFLNSDTKIIDVDFGELLAYAKNNPDLGALTVKVELPNGKLDLASHRGYPSIWRSFAYFSQLEKMFGSLPFLKKLFGGYHLLDRDFTKIHEIDSPSGAFYLSPKKILEALGGFDTRFFMYGEDLDLSLRIKKRGYKIIYYPHFVIIHQKYQSGIKNKKSVTKNKTRHHFFDAMKLYYDKHHADKNHTFVNKLIFFLIDIKKKLS